MYGKSGKAFCHHCLIVAKKSGKELDCYTCTNKMPEVPYELQALLNCFTLCEFQLRMGFSGAYALDYNAIIRIADDLGLKTDEAFYNFLKIFENILIKELNRDNKGK